MSNETKTGGKRSIPILQTLSPGGSGTGWSYYSTLATCPHMSYLDGQNSEALSNADSMVGANIGTIYHKLLEWYHGAELKDTILDCSEIEDSKTYQEAKRLYDGYTARVTPDQFGRVLHVEKFLPQNREKALQLEDVFCAPYTARLDMVVSNEDKLWIVDHKTADRRNKYLEDMYRWQMLGYILAWNTCYQNDPVEGAIMSVVYKHRNLTDDSFETFMFYLPTPTEIRYIQEFFKGVETTEMYVGQYRNLSACVKRWACRYLKDGTCFGGETDE